MSDDIPFDKTFDLPPGQVDEVVPGVRRILCNNPSPFTYKGTVSYIVGRGRVAIIDPGPLDEAHIAALLDAVRGETVTHIFVTHTHRDHSPAAAPVKARDRRAGLCRRAAPRRADAQCRRRRRGSMPAATPTSGPITRLPTARSCRATAGRWRRSPRPATPPITWRSRCAARSCCSPATTSWPGRRRWWRRRTAR